MPLTVCTLGSKQAAKLVIYANNRATPLARPSPIEIAQMRTSERAGLRIRSRLRYALAMGGVDECVFDLVLHLIYIFEAWSLAGKCLYIHTIHTSQYITITADFLSIYYSSQKVHITHTRHKHFFSLQASPPPSPHPPHYYHHHQPTDPTMSPPSESLNIAELAIYFPLLFLTVYVIYRHGMHRQSGWIYLSIFCLIRIIGSALGVASYEKKGGDVSDLEWSAILGSVGISPLLLASMGLLKRM